MIRKQPKCVENVQGRVNGGKKESAPLTVTIGTRPSEGSLGQSKGRDQMTNKIDFQAEASECYFTPKEHLLL